MKLYFSILLAFSMVLKTHAAPILVSSTSQVASKVSDMIYYTELESDTSLRLLVINAFGSICLKAKVNDCHATFHTESSIWNHAGMTTTMLLKGKSLLVKNYIEILPDTTKKALIEAYCGPKQILVGGKDFTMIVSSTLDSMDNIWPENTEVVFNYLHRNRKENHTTLTKKLHAYTRFYSGTKTGTPIISTSSNRAHHKEFDITLYPNHPVNFGLEYDRSHDYADQKEITKVSTSVIQDQYGNSIADGSVVYFQIESSTEDDISTTIGTTVNGVATVALKAPKRATIWSISAKIADYSSSSILRLKYKKAIQPFQVITNEKTITIGPIRGFMNQYVNDHTEVKLNFDNGEQSIQKTLYTQDALAYFDLKELNIKSGSYELTVDCGGQMHYTQISIP